jgi:hypothetical protein
MDGLRGAARNLSSENEPWSARDRGFLLPASTWRDPPMTMPVLPGDIGLEGREAWMPRCQLAADLVGRRQTRKSPQSHAIISLRDRRPLSCVSRARFGTTGQGCRRSVVVFAVFCSKISAKCRLSASDSLVFDRHASPKTAKNLAVPGCFRESPGRQRIAHAWRAEITNLTAKLQVVIPILAITSRAAQALGRLFATRLKRRLRVETRPSSTPRERQGCADSGPSRRRPGRGGSTQTTVFHPA